MPFIDCARLSQSSLRPKPVVLYLHETGYEEAFGSREDNGKANGVAYADGILVRYLNMLAPSEYILAALWGDEGERIAEFHGYNDVLQNWHGNSTFLDAWIFVNGVYVPNPKSKGCGETTMAFGEEEKFRRFESEDINDFIARHPSLPNYLWSASKVTI